MINLTLEALSRADLPQMFEWRNDYRIWSWTRQNDLIDELHHAAWFESQSKDPKIRMYKIVARTGGATSFIGVAGFTSIDFQSRRAEFSLYIGPQFHRRGFGKMALNVLVSHGFTNLGLNVIWGETFDGNPAARMFEAVGFVKEGTARQRYWKDGKFVDAHLYSILREEWLGKLKGSTEPLPDTNKRDASGGDSDPSLSNSERTGAVAARGVPTLVAEATPIGAAKETRKKRASRKR
jgi:RimJ/RimL family protein N-acetyltransferase